MRAHFFTAPRRKLLGQNIQPESNFTAVCFLAWL